MGLTLGLFGAAHIMIQPLRSLRKLIPLAVVGVLIGLPILAKLIEVSTANRMTDVLLSGDRYAETRLNWSLWAETASAPMLVLATGGALLLFRRHDLDRTTKILLGAYAVVCLAFAFGWLYGLNFAYIRATFFIILLGALGAAALASMWQSRGVRIGITALLLTVIGMGTLIRAQPLTDYFAALTPRVVEGARWLHEHSEPDDVVVVGTYFGYHMTRLLERPTLVAHAPDLVGNPDEAPFAEDGFAILMGLQGMDDALQRRAVRYIIVKARAPDIPDPARSMAVLDAHPAMRLLFRNSDMLIYGVEEAS